MIEGKNCNITILVPDKTFRWKTQNDEFLYPSDMETRHLFFTVRMIWNHSAPPALKLLPYREYSFGPHYTPEYMVKAVRNILYELMRRSDIKEEWKSQINFMFSQFEEIHRRLV